MNKTMSYGLKVTQVQDESQAKQIGLNVNDIIFKYNDSLLSMDSDLYSAMDNAKQQGIEISEITVFRNKNEIILKVSSNEPLGILIIPFVSSKDEKSKSNEELISEKMPLLTIVLYILAFLGFLVGILLCVQFWPENSKDSSTSLSLTWLLVGIIEATIFSSIGLALHYMKGIYINSKP